MRLEFQELEVAECITLAKAKEHCRIDGSAEDSYVTDLITRAREHCENWCGTPLLPQRWKVYYDWRDYCWPLQLPHSKVMSITEINTYDSDNDETEFDSDNYFLSGNRIILNSGASLPTDVRRYDSLAIEFVSGYGTLDDEDAIVEAVPTPAKQAMLMLMLHWHENRAAQYDAMNTSVSTIVQNMPHGVLALLQPYKRYSL